MGKWIASLGLRRHHLLLAGSIFLVFTLVGGMSAWFFNRPVSNQQKLGVASSSSRATTPTIAPVFTPLPTPLLGLPWHATSLPTSLRAAYTIAPSDGNTVYACFSAIPPEPTEIWVTRDRGSDWSHFATAMPSYECGVVVDDTDPTIAVIKIYDTFPYGSTRVLSARSPEAPYAGGPEETVDLLTVDAGQHWRNLPAQQFFTQLTSFGSLVYGIYTSSNVGLSLGVSADHFATWQRLDPSFMSGGGVPHLWVNDSNGALMAESGDGQSVATSLDSGASWATQPLPAAVGFVVATPLDNSWYICALHIDGLVDKSQLSCSPDGGKTWQTHNAPNNISHVIGMTISGEILCAGDPPSWAILRLKRGATQWQELDTNDDDVEYAAAPGDGIIWSFHHDVSDTQTVVTLDYP